MSPIDLPKVLAQSDVDLSDELACARHLKAKGHRLAGCLLTIRVAANNIRVAAAIARRHGERLVNEMHNELASFCWGFAGGLVIFAVCYGARI